MEAMNQGNEHFLRFHLSLVLLNTITTSVGSNHKEVLCCACFTRMDLLRKPVCRAALVRSNRHGFNSASRHPSQPGHLHSEEDVKILSFEQLPQEKQSIFQLIVSISTSQDLKKAKKKRLDLHSKIASRPENIGARQR